MSYRFTNTDKWNDSWFSGLKQLEMLLFMYLCDNCDIAGFMEINAKRWAVDLNTTADKIQQALKSISKGLYYSEDGECIYIRNFLKHQKNLPLNDRNNAHKGIIKCFEYYSEKFNIQDINTFLVRGSNGAKVGHSSPTGKGNSNSKGNNVVDITINDITIPDGFIDCFQKWMDYKKAKKQSYKSQITLQAACDRLVKLSTNNHELAEMIVEQSLANNWDGLFDLSMSDKSKMYFAKNVEMYRVNSIEYNDKDYSLFVEFLLGNNKAKVPMNNILSLKYQLSLDQFNEILDRAKEKGIKIRDMLLAIENKKTYTDGCESLYTILNNWINKEK